MWAKKFVDRHYGKVISSTKPCRVCHQVNEQTHHRCGACFKAVYCGVECQKKDWKSHSLICGNDDDVDDDDPNPSERKKQRKSKKDKSLSDVISPDVHDTSDGTTMGRLAFSSPQRSCEGAKNEEKKSKEIKHNEVVVCDWNNYNRCVGAGYVWLSFNYALVVAAVCLQHVERSVGQADGNSYTADSSTCPICAICCILCAAHYWHQQLDIR